MYNKSTANRSDRNYTVCVSLESFSYSQLFVGKSPNLIHTTCICRFRRGWPRSNFADIVQENARARHDIFLYCCYFSNLYFTDRVSRESIAIGRVRPSVCSTLSFEINWTLTSMFCVCMGHGIAHRGLTVQCRVAGSVHDEAVGQTSISDRGHEHCERQRGIIVFPATDQ